MDSHKVKSSKVKPKSKNEVREENLHFVSSPLPALPEVKLGLPRLAQPLIFRDMPLLVLPPASAANTPRIDETELVIGQFPGLGI